MKNSARNDLVFLAAGGGSTMLAAWLEELLAESHGGQIQEMHAHQETALVTPHIWLVAALVLLVWPVAREVWRAPRSRPSRWRLAGLGLVALITGSGRLMIAATAMLVLLAAELASRRS